MFRTVPLSIISSFFRCTHNIGICHTACEQDQDVTSWSCSQAVSKPVWYIPFLCVQWKTPDDRQRNCPKHVEFYSKNKFEKLMHLVGFIIRISNACKTACNNGDAYRHSLFATHFDITNEDGTLKFWTKFSFFSPDAIYFAVWPYLYS
jgi:hypothetical protein